jgi:hypothetical protein
MFWSSGRSLPEMQAVTRLLMVFVWHSISRRLTNVTSCHLAELIGQLNMLDMLLMGSLINYFIVKFSIFRLKKLYVESEMPARPDLREFVMVKNTMATNGLELISGEVETLAETGPPPPVVQVPFLHTIRYLMYMARPNHAVFPQGVIQISQSIL